MSTPDHRMASYSSGEISGGIRERVVRADVAACGVCLGFGYLPDVGPCPRCRPGEYAEYVLAWSRDVAEAEAAQAARGDAA